MTIYGTDTREVKIEQMLAFGRSDKWITAKLGATQKEIDDRRAHLEEVSAHEDDPKKDTGLYCRKGLHAVTPEDTYVDPKGRRFCRPCKRTSGGASDKRRRGTRDRRKAA